MMLDVKLIDVAVRVVDVREINVGTNPDPSPSQTEWKYILNYCLFVGKQRMRIGYRAQRRAA